jgi:hypothetical protein
MFIAPGKVPLGKNNSARYNQIQLQGAVGGNNLG